MVLLTGIYKFTELFFKWRRYACKMAHNYCLVTSPVTLAANFGMSTIFQGDVTRNSYLETGTEAQRFCTKMSPAPLMFYFLKTVTGSEKSVTGSIIFAFSQNRHRTNFAQLPTKDIHWQWALIPFLVTIFLPQVNHSHFISTACPNKSKAFFSFFFSFFFLFFFYSFFSSWWIW